MTPSAVASLAARAVGRMLRRGGAGLPTFAPGPGRIAAKEESSKGVEVGFTGDRVVIDLYVILEYGTRIITVAENIMSSVKFAVEQALGATGRRSQRQCPGYSC